MIAAKPLPSDADMIRALKDKGYTIYNNVGRLV